MANNIFGGKAQVVFAKVEAFIADMNVTAGNTRRIYWYDLVSNTVKSYDPSRTINAFNKIFANNGYAYYAITDQDKTAFFYPPFPTGSGTGIVTEDGNPIVPE